MDDIEVVYVGDRMILK